MVKVEVFSQGKVAGRNADHFQHHDSCFAIADGATDKSGREYGGKTGGEIVSQRAVEVCLSTTLDGAELVRQINGKVRELYAALHILKDIKDAKYRFTCGLICARITGKRLTITYVGDLGFRVNGKEAYQERREADTACAEERARYIKETGDVNGSREHIMASLLKQFTYQNSPNHQVGYGVIDGTETPRKFIKTFRYPLSDIKTLELFTDGYFEVPRNATIGAWERSYQRVERADPDKWKRFKSTKSKDDRTIAIIRF